VRRRWQKGRRWVAVDLVGGNPSIRPRRSAVMPVHRLLLSITASAWPSTRLARMANLARNISASTSARKPRNSISSPRPLALTCDWSRDCKSPSPTMDSFARMPWSLKIAQARIRCSWPLTNSSRPTQTASTTTLSHSCFRLTAGKSVGLQIKRTSRTRIVLRMLRATESDTTVARSGRTGQNHAANG
jgi:hypothetical protein